jgi:uncharacterized protein YjbI with pentapeptide repeats/uncharacterized protein YecT (DUF1311 family)
VRLLCFTLAFLAGGSGAAQAASFWERFPTYEADACRARIESESADAKRLTGEIGPEDLAAVKGIRVLVVEAEFKEGAYSGLDFSGFHFEDTLLSDRSFKGAKFKNAIFDNSVFSRSDFSGSDFTGAVLCSADFTEAKLSGAVFKDALLIGADFSFADAASAQLESARLYGGIFNSAKFEQAGFRSALVYCRPESTELPCASAEKSSFKGADFSAGAILIDLDGDFSDATLEGTAVIAEMIPRLKDSYFVRVDVAPHALGPDQPPLTLTRQDVSLLIEGWHEQAVSGQGEPSFDCRSASSKGERAVCGSPELAARDAFLAALYTEALAAGNGAEDLRAGQQDWLKAREDCASQRDQGCLPDVYDQRAFMLAAARGKIATRYARAGSYHPVADFATVPRTVLGSDLGKQLAALRARSLDGAVIEPPAEGTFAFSAEAAGVGGHTCALSGEFAYEPARGVYVYRVEGLEIAQIIVAGDMILFLGAQENCGLRAQWPRVMQLQSAAN